MCKKMLTSERPSLDVHALWPSFLCCFSRSLAAAAAAFSSAVFAFALPLRTALVRQCSRPELLREQQNPICMLEEAHLQGCAETEDNAQDQVSELPDSEVYGMLSQADARCAALCPEMHKGGLQT